MQLKRERHDQTSPPFQLLIRKPGGIHRLSARVVFTDGTPARTINFRFRICEPAVRALPPVTG